MKYKLLEEDFYSVAWSRMKVAAESSDQPVHNNNNNNGQNGAWILATSGFRGSVRLLRADRMTCVAEVKHHKSHVNSLLFHPSDPQLLFTGSADLSVCLWRFDPLAMPSHRTSHALLMKFVVPTNDDASTNDVLNLLLRGSHLLAATENDFVCWNCANIPHGAGSVGGGGFAGGANASSSSTKKSPKLARQRKPEFQAELPYMSTEYSVMDGMTQVCLTFLGEHKIRMFRIKPGYLHNCNCNFIVLYFNIKLHILLYILIYLMDKSMKHNNKVKYFVSA